jgi:uncharacterized membrane protein YcfT
MNDPILRLVPTKSSESTDNAISRLYAEAQDHQVIGLAAVVYYRGGTWTTLVAGECKRDPHRARGMVNILAEDLGALQRM